MLCPSFGIYCTCFEVGPRFSIQVANKNSQHSLIKSQAMLGYTVRYDAVNAMLLNEFLKEHCKVEEQGAIIAKQQKQIEALTAGLQEVSDQLEDEQARAANGPE